MSQMTYSGPTLDTPTGTATPNKTKVNPAKAAAATGGGLQYPGAARNAPCPCGSGKKYKVCHGKDAA
jgi:preprotein translocase subunit SecA